MVPINNYTNLRQKYKTRVLVFGVKISCQYRSIIHSLILDAKSPKLSKEENLSIHNKQQQSNSEQKHKHSYGKNNINQFSIFPFVEIRKKMLIKRKIYIKFRI